jgi:gliding motility-associated lipoprotein GldD
MNSKPQNKVALLLVLLTFTFIWGACQKKYTPKPKAYFRIDFPKKEYTPLKENYPYRFEYATNSLIENQKEEPYWINIQYPKYKGTIHLSYKKVNNNVTDYLEDSRKMVYKHAIKADAINEKLFTNPEKNVYGLLYRIKGNTASSLQFVATDSSRHFLRGALYFMEHPNQDSLAPVIHYIEKDVVHLMNTLSWK